MRRVEEAEPQLGRLLKQGEGHRPVSPTPCSSTCLMPASVLLTLFCPFHLATLQTCSPARASGVELRKVQVEKGRRVQLAPGGGMETS